MINLEYFYTEVLSDRFLNQGLLNGKLVNCSGIDCIECEFRSRGESCYDNKINWLLQECKEKIIPKLNQTEKLLCQALKHGYLIRDKTRVIWSLNRPEKAKNKHSAIWTYDSSYSIEFGDFIPFGEFTPPDFPLFTFIPDINDNPKVEPYSVEEVLKANED